MGRERRARDRADERVVDAPAICWLCERPLGARIERHHPVPKSRGGRATAPIHPICHHTLHARFTNKELERLGCDPATLRADEAIGRYLAWVASKDADFHAPVRRRNRGEHWTAKLTKLTILQRISSIDGHWFSPMSGGGAS